MKNFIEAIKAKDLTLVEKEFSTLMEGIKEKLIAERRVELASSVMIEGEEREDDDQEDDDSDNEKEDKE